MTKQKIKFEIINLSHTNYKDFLDTDIPKFILLGILADFGKDTTQILIIPAPFYPFPAPFYPFPTPFSLNTDVRKNSSKKFYTKS